MVHMARGIAGLKQKLLAPETRLVALKSLSLGAGVFLVLAGIVGCTAPITGGGMVYTIGSLYAVIFGMVVLTVELKDKTKLVSAFYQWIDTYIKFLTLQVSISIEHEILQSALLTEMCGCLCSRICTSAGREYST